MFKCPRKRFRTDLIHRSKVSYAVEIPGLAATAHLAAASHLEAENIDKRV
jgi:hypothetical protein